MPRIALWVSLIAIMSSVAVCGTGCEDSQARRRDEIHSIITRARAELHKNRAAAEDPANDAARTALQNVASELGQIGDGEPGQQAAAALLAAEARLALGRMDLTSARQIEAQNRSDRLLVHGLINVAGRLDAVASGQEQSSDAETRAALEKEQQAASAQLLAASETVAKLDGPMAAISKGNSADSAQVAALKRQSDDLYGRASQQGRAEGLDDFVRATQLRREYEQIQRRVGQREIELTYKYQPDADLAEARAEYIKELLDQIEQAKADLAATSEQTAAQTKALRDQLRHMREHVQKLLGDMNSRASGDLAARYESAVAHFEQAAGLADKAAGRGDRTAAGSARLTSVTARQSLADAHAARARGLADQIALLTRIESTGDAIAPIQKIAEERQKAQAEKVASIEQAVAALTTATESLAQATSRGNEQQIELLKTSLQRSSAGLTGQPLPPLAPPIPAGRDAQGGASAEAEPAAAGGFQSAEELLAFLQTMKASDPQAAQRFVNVLRAKTPAARQALAMMKASLEDATDLNRAIVEQFGQAALDEFTANALRSAAIPDFAQAEITDQSDDRATVHIPGAPSGSDDLELVRAGGLWYVEFEPTGGAPSNPMMDSGSAAMMQQMRGAMKTAFASVAVRVRAGEFADVAAVQQALQVEMGKQFGEAMGAAVKQMQPGRAPPRRPSGGADPEK